MKKTLGLDLGVSSIGWAVVGEEDDKRTIMGMGSRIIPLTVDDKNEFSSGNAISKNQKRTQKRTQRKGYDRYQLRRKNLLKELRLNSMLPNQELSNLDKIALWGLRSKAVTDKLSKEEIGRVLLHLNQKRGYKSSRTDANVAKKETDYVAEVKSRHEKLKELELTIGQNFHSELVHNSLYRIKDQVFPREAYVEEFNAICRKQKEYWPELLTDDFVSRLRDDTIYYQRHLKSQKGLVSVCEFEGFDIQVKNLDNGKTRTIYTGPKVAPRTSPLAQVCKIWESINNISIKDGFGEEVHITLEQKGEIFQYLDNHDKLTFKELLKILTLKPADNYYGNKMLEKGIQGNITKTAIIKSLGGNEGYDHHLQFDLQTETYNVIEKDTGLVLYENLQIISKEFEKQPLNRLWHVIYSISDTKEIENVLIDSYGFDASIATKLAGIDFRRQGFSNKSSKAMRKILPYLMNGMVYSDACALAGYNHSDSLTREENLHRELADKLCLLEKNSLRQPIVEKILNQLIHQVNVIVEKYGKVDEIRVELARELKQSREERNKSYSDLNKRTRENDKIAEILFNEYGIRATRKNIIKYRLFHEISGDDLKINAVCVYCGKPFGFSSAMNGNEVDVEHIIPKSKLFDDSQSNKTLSHRKCNAEKGDMTACDYMKTKQQAEFDEYITRIEKLFTDRVINKAKREKLLMPEHKIPQDFIERQLRESQYISRKAKELLSGICHNVYASSGTVTDYVRRIWGWDEVLMNIQLPKYREAGLTEWIDIEKEGQTQKKEIIKDWTKRKDHRHHAIDALAIACTKQGIVQNLNTLSSERTRNEMYRDVNDLDPDSLRSRSLTEAYIAKHQPFTHNEVLDVASKILISFKPGKKVVTGGVRKIRKGGKNIVVQKGVIVPRGALSEETLYGRIKIIEKNKTVRYLFENPDLIYKSRIKKMVVERLEQYNGSSADAVRSLKKDPIWLDSEKSVPLTYGTCYNNDYVVKYPVNQIKAKDIGSIVDSAIRQRFMERLEKYGGNEKEAFKNLDTDPIWQNREKGISIRSVRCLTGIGVAETVRRNGNGVDIGFVKPGNNHHLAVYESSDGTLVEHICTFWHAVERKRYELPIIIERPDGVWDKIIQSGIELPEPFLNKLPNAGLRFRLSLQQNEMFLLGISEDEVKSMIINQEYSQLSNYLYRVQKIGESYYVFRHHLETELIDTNAAMNMKVFFRVHSLNALFKLDPFKVWVNRLGEVRLSK